jgi:hypothetical protein
MPVLTTVPSLQSMQPFLDSLTTGFLERSLAICEDSHSKELLLRKALIGDLALRLSYFVVVAPVISNPSFLYLMLEKRLCNDLLAQYAENLGLVSLLETQPLYNKGVGIKNRASAFEAFFGTLFLENDLDICNKFLSDNIYNDFLEKYDRVDNPEFISNIGESIISLWMSLQIYQAWGKNVPKSRKSLPSNLKNVYGELIEKIPCVHTKETLNHLLGMMFHTEGLENTLGYIGSTVTIY